MSIIEIIPKREEIGKSLALADKYQAAFEYNDFYSPNVLDDPKQIDNLISFYLKLPHDRSKDTLHGAFLDMVIHSADSQIRRISDYRMRQSMDIAKALGIRGVVFHTNLIANFRDKPYQENWLKQNRDYFLALATDYPDIEIFMENMFDLSPTMFAAFGEATKDCPTVHLCLDIAHAHLSDVPVAEWIRQSYPYVRHLHVNDNDGISDLHLAVGQGSLDWEEFNRMARQYQLTSSLLVETSSVEGQAESLRFLEANHIYPFL
ncbi:MAG: sugar phosphate isomerase/epimerase [Candidatus Gastranaerophilales bacterium]|nr:sugar phosphate isomerase/epimerase [Candidatus Gastranaerophilales bacterium]